MQALKLLELALQFNDEAAGVVNVRHHAPEVVKAMRKEIKGIKTAKDFLDIVSNYDLGAFDEESEFEGFTKGEILYSLASHILADGCKEYREYIDRQTEELP